MAYVPVPKDLDRVKNKVAFNLTMRQAVCLAIAAAVGIPFYIAARDILGVSNATTGMAILMLPVFFFALYEKDGLPLEKVLMNMANVKLIRPAERKYGRESSKGNKKKKQKDPKNKTHSKTASEESCEAEAIVAKTGRIGELTTEALGKKEHEIKIREPEKASISVEKTAVPEKSELEEEQACSDELDGSLTTEEQHIKDIKPVEKNLPTYEAQSTENASLTDEVEVAEIARETAEAETVIHSVNSPASNEEAYLDSLLASLERRCP